MGLGLGLNRKEFQGEGTGCSGHGGHRGAGTQGETVSLGVPDLGSLQTPIPSSFLQVSEQVEHQGQAGFLSGEWGTGWLCL